MFRSHKASSNQPSAISEQLPSPIPNSSSPDEGLRLTRRQLFKLGAVGAAMAATSAVAAKAAMAEDLIRGGRSVSRTTGLVRAAVASTCALCTARCGILGFVEDGRLVKIEGNPRDPNSRGRLCARGHAGINRLYDPDRVLTPMKRAGNRGEGRWTQITWEEAYQTLQDRIQELQARQPESLVLHTGAEAAAMLGKRFVAAVGSKVLIDETRLQEASREAAGRSVLGAAGEVVDVSRARYILNFGGNPYESHPLYLAFVQRLVDARMDGAKLVTFDPRLSLTAGRSDEWLPVTPGSDGMVALAMAGVILQQNLHDAQFLSRWSDVSRAEMARQLAPFTPEAAAAASGVSGETIRRLATEFARVRPTVAISGGGVSYQAGAVDTQRAVLLLNAVVGAIGTPGGHSPATDIGFQDPDPVPGETLSASDTLQFVDAYLQGSRRAGIYMTALANPAYSWPDPAAFRQALLDENRTSFLVAIDTNMTETSALADLFLPAATYLESWGLESPPSQEMVPFVGLRQPVVRARGDSLSVDDMLLTMGTRLAGQAPQLFPYPTVEVYVNKVVSKVPGLGDTGLATLKERGVWYDTGRVPQYLPSDGFATPSGKLQLGSIADAKGLASGGSGAVSVNGDSRELTLVTYRPNVHSGEYSANCWWLAEINHNNALLINPVAAQQRGIKQGQRVKVISAAGEVETSVRITQGIHPQVVALALGFGHSAVGRIARGEQFKGSDPMTVHIWWDRQGNGVNATSLIPGKRADGGGGLVWMDTRVRVEAVG
jgi:thiosulfate reductase/polysulfide reductase chain A